MNTLAPIQETVIDRTDVKRVPFAAGERVMWLGDSITQSGDFHAMITLFQVTRAPKDACTWLNAGMSGDSAEGALRRWSWDIAPRQPSLAIVMFGMNDVQRHLYAQNLRNDPVSECLQLQALDQYGQRMAKLTQQLRDRGGRWIGVTPSIFDQTGDLPAENLIGVNDALAVCGYRVAQIADEQGMSYIDLHGSMSRCNEHVQVQGIQATIVGNDRVHPGPAGHWFMAATVLKSFGVSRCVARVAINSEQSTVEQADYCQITLVSANALGVEYRYLATSLPYPVSSAAQASYAWDASLAQWSQELITISGLSPGRYRVEMDGHLVAVVSREELAAGWNMGQVSASPRYQQAELVAGHNAERHRIISQEIRTVDCLRHFIIDKEGIDWHDHQVVEARIAQHIRDASQRGGTFGVTQGETFLRNVRRIDALTQAAEDAERAMYAAAQVEAVTIRIQRL